VSKSGGFFLASAPAVERLEQGLLGEADQTFLSLHGHVVAPDDRLASAARSLDILRRSSPATQLDYLILVPTLRCNLSCSYCQVSRVSEGRRGSTGMRIRSSPCSPAWIARGEAREDRIPGR
jgi:hypothetical protein